MDMEELLNKKHKIDKEHNNNYGITGEVRKRVYRGRNSLIFREIDGRHIGFKPEEAQIRDRWILEHEEVVRQANQD